MLSPQTGARARPGARRLDRLGQCQLVRSRLRRGKKTLDLLVPRATEGRIVDVSFVADLARQILDELAPRVAPGLELRQHVRRRLARRSKLGQDDGVLDGHGRTLRDMRARRVRGIPDQDHAAFVPGEGEDHLLDRNVDDVLGVAGFSANVGEHSAERRHARRQELSQPIRRHPGIAGFVRNEQQIHRIARQRDEPGLYADAEIHALIGQGARPARRVAPHAVACEPRLERVAEHERSDLGANPIGPDHEVVGGRCAVGKHHVDAVSRLGKLIDRDAELDVCAGARGRVGQDLMQGRAGQHVNRGRVCVGDPQQLQAGEHVLVGVVIAVFVGLVPGAQTRLQDADRFQRAQRVPGLDDPHTVDGGVRLELGHVAADALLSQRCRNGEAADAATHHQN